MKGYKFVQDRFAELGMIGQISSILSWDANVMMPKKSSDVRGEQLAYLSKKMHQIMTDEAVQEHIAIAMQNTANIDPWEHANLELINHQVINATALPSSLVEELAIASNKCEMIWRDAKATNNFKLVADPLKTLLHLVIESAGLRGNHLGLSPYNALLNDYDRSRTTEELDILFSDLKQFLIEFAPRVIEQQKQVEFKQKPIDKEKQRLVFEKYLHMLNFDFEAGRLDASTHPFCGGIPDDSRITTWFKEDDFISGIYGVIHEGGHSLYERNLPKEWRLQPVGRGCGFAIHESQSLFIEKQIGMHPDFIKNLYKEMQASFGFDELNLQDFERVVSNVERSFIRVDADEVTYPLHVIMRYEIEKDLIDKKLKVEDLPERWNSEMQTIFGITPTTDSLGCMQDIHWHAGYFGYFPAYTVGSLTAAQLMHKIRQDVGNVDSLIANENLKPIITWLNKNIHAHGSRYTPSELIKLATGKPLNAQYFKDYLRARYLG
jgi:carboxypeptidase Taq